jgi:hypothetical protein
MEPSPVQIARGLIDPLSAILGNTQLALRDPSLSPAIRDQLRAVELQAQLMRDDLQLLLTLLAQSGKPDVAFK